MYHNHSSLSGVVRRLIRWWGLQEADPPLEESLSSSLDTDPVSPSWVSPQSLVDLRLTVTWALALALEVPDQLLLLKLFPGRKTRTKKNTVSLSSRARATPSSKDKMLSSLLSSPMEDWSVLIKSPRSLCRSILLQFRCRSGSASEGRTEGCSILACFLRSL